MADPFAVRVAEELDLPIEPTDRLFAQAAFHRFEAEHVERTLRHYVENDLDLNFLFKLFTAHPRAARDWPGIPDPGRDPRGPADPEPEEREYTLIEHIGYGTSWALIIGVLAVLAWWLL